MIRRQRGRGSSGSVSSNKNQNFKVVAEEEVFSPKILPIDDPWEEKRIIEKRKNPYYEYLIGKLGTSSLGWTEGSLYNRIREVYRLCFESRKKEGMKVINDFVAFHPNLAFSTPWLAEVVKTHTTFENPEYSSPRTRLLEALSAGFRRAADSPRYKRHARASREDAARMVMKSFKDEFSAIYKSDDWKVTSNQDQNKDKDKHNTTRKAIISEKVAELMGRYSECPTIENIRQDLQKHLLEKRARKAAVLITHTLCKVPARKIEGKTSF